MDTRVAVAGARGIGRHHANWWHLEGARVVAVLGTTPESLESTCAALHEMFGFEGRGYTNLATLLAEESPDIVDVCSPPEFHAAHVRQALEAGRHVLCEKPFVYDFRLSRDDVLAEARDLFDLAESRGLRLSVCTQYSAGARFLQQHWTQHHPDEPIRRYHGHLESPAKGRAADPIRVWVDLSPHVISVFNALFPGASVRWETLDTSFTGYEAIAKFKAETSGGQTVDAEFYTRNRTEPPNNIRHFRLNEQRYEVLGARGDDGVFHARIETGEGTYDEPDMMRLLIRDCLHGNPTVGREAVLANLSIMLTILERSSA